jgi:hypothetical protein
MYCEKWKNKCLKSKKLFFVGLVASAILFVYFLYFYYNTFIHTSIRRESTLVSSPLSRGPPWGAEPRFEPGPAVQQAADALLSELRRTLTWATPHLIIIIALFVIVLWREFNWVLKIPRGEANKSANRWGKKRAKVGVVPPSVLLLPTPCAHQIFFFTRHRCLLLHLNKTYKVRGKQ